MSVWNPKVDLFESRVRQVIALDLKKNKLNPYTCTEGKCYILCSQMFVCVCGGGEENKLIKKQPSSNPTYITKRGSKTMIRFDPHSPTTLSHSIVHI